MKRPPFLPLLCLWFAAASAISAAPIQNLKFTDVVKDVKVLNVATKQETTAKVGDTLAPPNVIKTGADSRAELIAEDQTVTRVGANTIFSVEANSRDVNIAKGSVLFHSPAGKGGGNIKSAGATASVLGTTLIVGANQSGGFKVMLLEGKGQVTGAGGGASKLNAGQMSFAMPGKSPSQPLNFALKGQVSGSKLVGGFSKPLASIAKIEAAVAVQQSKLESGKLESTGLMIGDSPGTAFTLDPVVVRQVSESVKRVIIAQEEAEAKTEVPTRDKLDPRFLLAVKASLELPVKITGNSIPEPFEQPIPINLESVTLSEFLAKQTLGNYTEKNYGAPINIPGNRESFGLMTLLVAGNLDFSVDSMENSPGFFLNAPFVEGKNFSGILATQNIVVSKSFDFLDSTEYDEANVAIPKNFLLSAGRTITAGSGTVMKANAAIFDIYTAGTGFSVANSRDGFLSEISELSKVPLALANSMIWNDSAGGLLRIQAPEILFKNQTIYADSIEIGASGPIGLSVDAPILKTIRGFKDQYDTEVIPSEKDSILSSASGNQVPLPLGFDGPEALAVQAFNVSIRSTGKPIRIEGVPILTNNLTIASGFVAKLEEGVSIQQGSKDVTLTSTAGVSVGQPVSGSGIPTGTVVKLVNYANGTITLSNGVTITDTVDLTIGTPSAAQVDGSVTLSKVALNPRQGVNPNNEPQFLTIHATGDLTIIDSEFPYATTIDLRANRNANLTSTNFQDIEDLSVWADQDITFEAVGVTGDMAENSKVSVTSKKGSIRLNNNGTEATLQTDKTTTRTVMVAKKVNFTANNGDIVINSYEFRGDGTGKQEVTAKAKEVLGVYNTSLTDAAKVSLAANTVVLRDVSFKGGSDVTLKSKDGLVATDPGRNNPVQAGKVNFISGVKYGEHEIKLKDNSTYRSTTLNHSQFQDALKDTHGDHFSKLVIGQK
jgi:hypothetical protein